MVTEEMVTEEENSVRVAGDAAARVVRESTAPPPDRITLSNGVVLKLKPVSGLLIRRAISQVPKPQVPMWPNPDRDNREEPNPNDPDYLDKMDMYDETSGMAAMNVMFLVGTKVELPLPDGIEAPESDAWIDELRFLDMEVRTENPGRYLDWLKYVALSTMEDTIALSVAVGRMSGLQEQDVVNAMASFRRAETRGVDPRPPAEGAGDGDSVREGSAGDSGGA